METFRKAVHRHKHADQRGLSITVHWGTKGIERGREEDASEGE